jgi:hypothetical protein
MRRAIFCSAFLLFSSWSIAQTILSNESLVKTTLVVNKTEVTAQCLRDGCKASRPMLVSIPVNCPASSGKTCTFHIALDAKVSMAIGCATCSAYPGSIGSYGFLIDGAPPTVGPTDAHGNYQFEQNVYTQPPSGLVDRESYPASVVTSTQSGNHTIDVSIGCRDQNISGGCRVTAHWSTMRVDVFEP